MQGIYQIKNLINGHCYVGQSMDIEKRWEDHTYTVNNSKLLAYHYPLYRAIRKHGIDNFYFTVLEEVDSPDDLTLRELYWYETLNPEYNQISPKDNISSVRKIPVVAISPDTFEVVARYESMAEAGRMVGTATINIKRVCDGGTAKARGHYWCYEKDLDTWTKPIDHKNGKPIYQIDKHTGEVIAEFESLSDAERKTGITFGNISNNIRGHNKSAGGYVWKAKE
jgi:group I intron endonuclease